MNHRNNDISIVKPQSPGSHAWRYISTSVVSSNDWPVVAHLAICREVYKHRFQKSIYSQTKKAVQILNWKFIWQDRVIAFVSWLMLKIHFKQKRNTCLVVAKLWSQKTTNSERDASNKNYVSTSECLEQLCGFEHARKTDFSAMELWWKLLTKCSNMLKTSSNILVGFWRI